MDSLIEILCKAKGKSGDILLHLIDPSENINTCAYENKLLEYCLDRIGRRKNVYWLQTEMPKFGACSTRKFNPIAYKKLQLFAMHPIEIIENVEYMVKTMAYIERNQMSAMVMNFTDYHEISAFDVSFIFEYIRKLSIHIKLCYPDMKEPQRLLICLPATDNVMNVISRLSSYELVYL